MFDSLINVTNEEWNIMKNHLYRVEYKKNDIILMPGENEEFIYFLTRGVIRYFFYSPTKKDFTLGFKTGLNAFCAYTSFITQKPSNVGTQAMSDVVAYRVSFSDMEKLYVEMDRMETLSRMFLQLAYVEKEEKEFNLLSNTATSFYKYFCCKYPEIIENVPQKFIASYMGVAPESLSRIKSEIKKNNCNCQALILDEKHT